MESVNFMLRCHVFASTLILLDEVGGRSQSAAVDLLALCDATVRHHHHPVEAATLATPHAYALVCAARDS